MLTINERLTADTAEATTTLTLPFELRQKSRFRAKLDDGRDVGVMLSRGKILNAGDLLRADDGSVIQIKAASEHVTTASDADRLLIARACYHLGNRHVPLQIGETWLRYLQDHVLDEMIKSLGLSINHEHAPFEPETGAYSGHVHTHDPSDDPSTGAHRHAHSH
jgi:urease accessory protein